MHCEQPNPKLYVFDGYVEVPGGGKDALDASNLLLRGSSLRKTDWVVRRQPARPPPQLQAGPCLAPGWPQPASRLRSCAARPRPRRPPAHLPACLSPARRWVPLPPPGATPRSCRT